MVNNIWYMTQFPEALFPPTNHYDDYVNKIQLALDVLPLRECIIGGVARNTGINVVYQVCRNI